MINAPIFNILKNVPAVTALLGTDPVRIYPWGRAPQNPTKPYAVYAVYNAIPENYLGQRPDIDNKGTQINVYGDTSDSVDACFKAIRDALEDHAHMTAFSSPDREAETNLYSCRLEFDFWDER